ncbi:MAG: hypothetical protein HYT07_04015 [Candidatus Levybacteria bacterium]|nr:hypothetical protein [Candidatus Levybacteria bacterium]
MKESGKNRLFEKLPSKLNKAVIGITKSPGGKEIIGMTLNGKNWIHYLTVEDVASGRARVKLDVKYGISSLSLSGLPSNWREILERRELVLDKIDGIGGNSVEIFVRAEIFDYLPKATWLESAL